MAAGRAFNDGQEIVIEDLNSITSAIERQLFGRLAYQLVLRQENAFFGDSLLVTYSSANSVIVKKGFGLQTDSAQASPESQIRPINIDADTTLTIATPSSSLPRIDLICVRADVAPEITASRNYKDASTGTVSVQTLTVQKDWRASLSVVQGTANASPVAPAVPTGFIKIATLTVAAVSGLSGSGAVTDNRVLMPIGSLGTVNSLAFQRLTAGAAVSVAQLLADADTFLKFGKFQYFDLEELDTAESDPVPGSPPTDFRRFYFRDGTFYQKDPSGAITPVGSGGGGGGGANWFADQGTGPVEGSENGERVWFFDATDKGIAVQKLELFVRVPSSYIPGRQISMLIGSYSPSASLTQLLLARTTLIRKNLDAMDTAANQYASTNTALTNTVAKMYREISLDLSSPLGTINSLSVSPGDLIKVEVYRGTDTDTADVRFIPSATEIKFS